MTIRVLFADDQIPSEKDADNKRARDEIVKELKETLPNIELEYEKDHRWLVGLLNYLSTRQGLEIVRAKTFAEAKAQLKERNTFDVAVIDLAWTGDPSLGSDEKANAGHKLLQSLSEENKRAHDYKPAIAFSESFKKDLGLVADVLEKGALPIQKDGTEVGNRTLGAAIKLLARIATPLETKLTSDAGKLTVSQLLKLLVSLTIPQFWGAASAIVGAVGALFAFAFWLGKTYGNS